MKSRKFGFLHHYRRIRIEGTDLGRVINKCIKEDIDLRNLQCENKLESTVEVKGDDFDRLSKAAGNSYRITVIGEGGAAPFLKTMKSNAAAIAGAFLLGAFIFYQSLFIAEIRIDGYSSISEESLRRVIADAGLYEGAKKPRDYGDVKKAIYEEFDNITWASIYEDGRLLKISIAEASDNEEAEVPDDSPADIVASKSGMIESITPLKGNAVVEKGDYVNEGDVLISGEFEYQSSDYSRGDDIFVMYSHAEGGVLARTPHMLTYYMEKNRRIKEKTGNRMFGIVLEFGDVHIDTVSYFNRYEASVRTEHSLLDTVKPLPVKISFVKLEEVDIKEEHMDMEKAQAVVEAAVRQYQRENMKDGAQVTDSSVDYSESEGLLRADVLLEVLEDIGEEKPIKVKKENKDKQEDREQ